MFSSILRLSTINRHTWFKRYKSSSSRRSLFNASTTTLLRYSYLFGNQTGNNTINKLCLHALPLISYEVSIISECKPTNRWIIHERMLDCVWNVMAHAQKPDFVFRGNGQVHLNRRRRHVSRLLAAEVRASAVVMVVMLDTTSSEVSLSLPLPCVTICHHISTGLYTTQTRIISFIFLNSWFQRHFHW
jgi:hypothetical protein